MDTIAANCRNCGSAVEVYFSVSAGGVLLVEPCDYCLEEFWDEGYDLAVDKYASPL